MPIAEMLKAFLSMIAQYKALVEKIRKTEETESGEESPRTVTRTSLEKKHASRVSVFVEHLKDEIVSFLEFETEAAPALASVLVDEIVPYVRAYRDLIVDRHLAAMSVQVQDDDERDEEIAEARKMADAIQTQFAFLQTDMAQTLIQSDEALAKLFAKVPTKTTSKGNVTLEIPNKPALKNENAGPKGRSAKTKRFSWYLNGEKTAAKDPREFALVYLGITSDKFNSLVKQHCGEKAWDSNFKFEWDGNVIEGRR